MKEHDTRRLPSALQRGVTLIETMVAMALGLAVASVVVGFFGPASANRNELESVARLHDNAAYAAELLSDELRAAGYYGELRQAGMTWQVPDPCAATLAALGWAAPSTAPMAVIGIDAAEATPACITDRRAGTDIVTLRRADVTGVAPAALTEGAYLQVSKCATDPSLKPFVFSASAPDFDLRNRDCASLAVARRFLVRTYFIKCAPGCGSGTVPTLTRAELWSNGPNLIVRETPLVDGIESLQLEYGFDTNGDGAPDVYRTGLSGVAGAGDNDWSNVVAVRFYLVARTTRPTPGYSDQKRFVLGLAGVTGPAGDAYKRHLHTAVVRVVNPAAVRERP